MLTGGFRPGSQGSGRSARVVDSYFRIWYYARMKWATPQLRLYLSQLNDVFVFTAE